MAWYDELGNAARMGGEFLLAAKAPAMYKALQDSQNRARDQQERTAFMNKYIGQKRDDTYNVNPVQSDSGLQMHTGGFGNEGSGQLGGQWSPMQSALEMMKAPTAINRTAGGGAFKDLLTARDGGARNLQMFQGGVAGSPNMRQQYSIDPQTRKASPMEGVEPWQVKNQEINIDRGQNEYEKTMGKGNATRMLSLQQSADDATNMAAEYSTIAALGEGLHTGTAGNFVQSVRKLADAFGMELPDSIDSISGNASSRAELIKSLSNKLVMKVRGQKDAGLTGSTSNRDLEFLIESIPGLMNTPGGLEYISEAMNNYAGLQRSRADYADSLGPYNNANRAKVRRRFKDGSILPQREMPGVEKKETQKAEQNIPNVITDKSGVIWEYAGTGDRKKQSSYRRASP
jgi:hypothetical protein